MIQETINLVVNNPEYAPSSGDNLLGMEYDIEHAFESNKAFDRVNIKRTEDKHGMFQINLTVSDKVESVHDVHHALQEAWDFIRYPYYESSSIIMGVDKAALRFVTAIDHNQFYVTGLVWVAGAAYEKIAKNA